MKRLLYLIIIFVTSGICFSSCGSHRSSTKQETHIEQVDSSQQVIGFGYTSVRDIASFLKSSTDIKGNWKLYDTSKPKDPDTGKHPLLAEGDIEESNMTEQSTDIATADSASLNADSSSSSQRQENDKQEVQKQKDETSIPKQVKGAVLAVCILVLLIFITKFLNK